MGSLELKYRSVMKEAAYLAAFIIYGDLVIEPEQIFVIKLKPDGISCTIYYECLIMAIDSCFQHRFGEN